MSNQAKVGVFAVIALAALGWFILRIENVRWTGTGRSEYKVAMANAQGLAAKAPVQLRGVRVGRVKDLEFVGDRVVATLELERRLDLRQGTRAQIASVGLLGEKVLDLLPGPPDAPPLPPESTIEAVAGISLDEVITRIGAIGGDVKAVTGAVSSALGTPEATEDLQKILSTLADTTDEIRIAIGNNQDEIRRTVIEVRRFAAATAEVMENLSALTGNLRGSTEGVGGSGLNLAELGADVAGTAENLNEITSRLERGEGTLGRLLADDGTGGEGGTLESSLSGVSRAVDFVGRTRIGFGLRGDYLFGARDPKSYLHFELRPPSPVFLRLEAVARPPTLTRRVRTVTEGPDGEEVVSDQLEYSDTLAMTALLGVREQAFQVRGGFIESTPGFGADAYLFADRVRLSADLWSLTRQLPEVPHARLEAAVRPWPWLSVIGGWDDPFAAERSSLFLGAGVHWQTGN